MRKRLKKSKKVLNLWSSVAEVDIVGTFSAGVRMRTLVVALAVVAGLIPGLAFADDSLEMTAETEVRFMKNFDAKIRSLENYSAVYSDGTVLRKSNSVAAKDGLRVKLIPVRKKG